MAHLKHDVNLFFDRLELYEDIANGHSYKAYLRQAVEAFLLNETKENAFAVYRAFFDVYRVRLEGDSNPFLDLLDLLKAYEENAATLIDKQRDHYIHSVNVFLLGLTIYAKNAPYRACFQNAALDKAVYPYSYDTAHEEFFYRWGHAALFHDVGYPVEIIGRQIDKFIRFAADADGDEVRVKSHLEFENFEELNAIKEILPKRAFTQEYYDRYESCVYVDLLKPLDLIAHRIHLTLGVDVREIKRALDGFLSVMAKNGFIDHGYYSALIVLKWYGCLIQECRYNPAYFFHPILDAASAILLHNYYRNALQKPPFSLGPLSPAQHPLAYLLILSDELQEWNREAYGILDRKRAQAGAASVAADDRQLYVTYLVRTGVLPETFSREKEQLLCRVLDMGALFPDGISIDCTASAEMAPLLERAKRSPVPRPLLDNLEKLAIAIHEQYNRSQRERFPDRPVDYPRFSDLPDSVKYANLRQARGIADKLEKIGCEMRPCSEPGERVTSFDPATVEFLARLEHDDWMAERLESGWVYGAVKDVEKKTSPYLCPYDALDDDVKKLDRDAVTNIPVLLDMIGMYVCRR